MENLESLREKMYVQKRFTKTFPLIGITLFTMAFVNCINFLWNGVEPLGEWPVKELVKFIISNLVAGSIYFLLMKMIYKKGTTKLEKQLEEAEKKANLT